MRSSSPPFQELHGHAAGGPDRRLHRPAGPAVLVSQITAGGVGLNIQAASVVILAEPQWKPTIEEQAIARCHRMGRVRSVNVHRLLTEDSVDERMLDILAGKSAMFDEYVRRSGLKAEAERRIIEMERKRLRLNETRDAKGRSPG